MAESIVVTIFNNEQDAMSMERHFHSMAEKKQIKLGNIAIIRKKADGSFENLKTETNGLGPPTFVGFAIGGIVTLFFGPLLFLLGALTGTAVGAVVGHEENKIDGDFILKVQDEIKTGDIAVIANCEEHDSTVLDETMQNFNNAKLYRTTV